MSKWGGDWIWGDGTLWAQKKWRSGWVWGDGTVWGQSPVSRDLSILWDSHGTSWVSRDTSILWQSDSSISRNQSILWSNQISRDASILWDSSSRLSLDSSILWDNISQEFGNWLTGSSADLEPPGLTVTIKNLSTGEEKILDGVVSVRFDRKRNQPISWSVVLENGDGRYSPRNTTSPFYGWITPDIWDSTNRIIRVVRIKLTFGNYTWLSPMLVIKNVKASFPGHTVVISGIDLTEYLLRENQSMQAFISRPGTVYTAYSVTRAILNAYNITNFSWGVPSYLDYPIWKLYFRGQRPLDVLTRIWSIIRVVWYWDRDTLYINKRDFKKNGPAYQHIKAGEGLISLEHSLSTGRLYNIVEVRRTLDAQRGGEEEGIDVGNIVITISPPLWNIQHTLQLQFCKVADGTFFYWDVDDKYYPSPPTDRPVAKISFFLLPDPPKIPGTDTPSAGYTPYWKFRWKGIPVYSDLVLESSMFDMQFSVRVRNQTSINKYGQQVAPDPIEDPLIPNSEIATHVGKMYLEESGRLTDLFDLACVLDPRLIPGMTIKVTENHLAIDNYLFLEEVGWDWPGVGMNATLSLYPT